MKHISNDENDHPTFGHHLGFIYPLVHRILYTHKYWSPSQWLPIHSALATDIYICVWWILESFAAFCLCKLSLQENHLIIWSIILLIFFRYIDLMFVLSSILVKGFYKKQDWASNHRITILVVLNSIEIMFLFAILYYAFGIIFPIEASTEPALNSFFNSLYFSIITGTSIGYGIPHPMGWIAKVLSMLEGSSIVLVVIAVIGYITNEKNRKV